MQVLTLILYYPQHKILSEVVGARYSSKNVVLSAETHDVAELQQHLKHETHCTRKPYSAENLLDSTFSPAQA